MPTADLSIGPPPEPEVSTAGVDPDAPPPQWSDDVLEPGMVEEHPDVPEPVVRGILSTFGALLAMSPLADPDVDEHWHFTERELDDLTPPLTRIVNARPTLRAAAARGDEVTVAVQLAGYAGRNVIAGGLARRSRSNQPEEWERGNVEREAGGAPAADRPSGDGPGVDGPEFGVPGSVGFGITPPAG